MSSGGWKYCTKSDKRRAAAGTIAGAVVFAATAALLFSPVVLGISAWVWGCSKVFAWMEARHQSDERLRAEKRPIKRISRPRTPPQQAAFEKVVAKASRVFGMKKAPGVCLRTAQQITAGQGFLEKWKWSKASFEEKMQILRGTFFVYPGGDTIFTTWQALNGNFSKREQAFIASHEITHLQPENDFISSHHAKQAIKDISGMTAALSIPLLFCVACGVPASLVFGAPLLSVMAVTGPVTFMAATATAIGGLYLTKNFLAETGFKFVSRHVTERQADRNALYKTGDLKAACASLSKIYEKKNGNPLYEAWRSHQRLEKRLATLRHAWPKVLEARRHDPVHPISHRQMKLAKRRGYINSVK